MRIYIYNSVSYILNLFSKLLKYPSDKSFSSNGLKLHEYLHYTRWCIYIILLKNSNR